MGTDGMQFEPSANTDQQLFAYVSDLARTASFNFLYTNTEKYEGLSLNMYELDPRMMLEMNTNKDNVPY